MLQKPSFTSSFEILIGNPWWQSFATVCIIRFSTSPSWSMASGCAIFLVLSFTNVGFTPLLNSVNDRSRMHMYGLYLWGIIFTGEIFNFLGSCLWYSPTSPCGCICAWFIRGLLTELAPRLPSKSRSMWSTLDHQLYMFLQNIVPAMHWKPITCVPL